ncbi:MAG TPA: carboxymuconolactone decarboxylase family protein [Pirellulaceae bacterium]|nr:carboxymuconolactone decarboxylase family protein [Pirellulaceae bacterium]HMO93121.1 carboxymuconolactone decarboxylase family protein [Pirellulaceae bacterium]HMP70320.1 carboxymuconolactone decarboxylase family protein [Pirellulaceae bacterium]
MAWIEIIPPEQATGILKQEYDAAIQRAGRIWNIVSIMSQNPAVMRASMEFYKRLMHDRSPLSRSQREMLAVVVSAANHCIY